jgi:phosphoglucosamine mutase
MKNFFGTDGIRGAYGSEIMNEDFAHKVGWAISQFLIQGGLTCPNVAVGCDTRPSSPTLRKHLVEGLVSGGATVKDCGILPTPALAFGVIKYGFHFGVMVTASHNPHQDNGIKCFSGCGTKLSESEEEEIEHWIGHDSVHSSTSQPEHISVLTDYLSHLESRFHGLNLSGMRIALDSANGATCKTSQTMLERFGATVFSIHQGEGMINDHCGSEYLESLSNLVRSKKADMGIAHDGDGDRVRFVDRDGQTIDGDQVLGLLALHAHRTKSLRSSTFVSTVHSNSGLAETLKANGIRLGRAKVGDRNVYQKMLEGKSNWGGESSGHIICMDYLPTGDGLFAALSVLDAIQKQATDLRVLARKTTLWPLRSESFPVAEKIPVKNVPDLIQCLKAEEEFLHDQGRILLRYSGTEPKIRLLVEGVSTGLINQSFNRIAEVIQKSL